jgi:hypothetical protein
MADARLKGEALPFLFEDREFRWVPRTFAVEAAFQKEHETRAYRAIQRHKKTLDPDDYQAQLTGWRQDLSAEVYTWGEPLSWRFLWSLPGLKYLAYLQLKEGEKHGGAEVDLHLVDRLAQDPEKWQELFDLMLAIDYPNLRRPAMEAPAVS